MQYNTMGQRFKHAIYLINNKPKKSMWLVLLGIIASCVITAACGYFEIIGIPLTLGISAGISLICLKCVRNDDPEARDLFAAFKDWKTIKRVIGGLLFTGLILLPWLVVPAVIIAVASIFGFGAISFDDSHSFFFGMHDFEYIFDNGYFLYTGIFLVIAAIVICTFSVLFIIKTLEVAFVPYILVSREDVSPFDAWKESKKLTYGLKGRMFGFVFLPYLVFVIVAGILFALSLIPIIGSIFLIALTALCLFGIVILPYFLRLGMAGFYEASLHAPKIIYDYQQQNPQPNQQQNLQPSNYQEPPKAGAEPPAAQPEPDGELIGGQTAAPTVSKSVDTPENTEPQSQPNQPSSNESSGDQPLEEPSQKDEN